MASADTLQREVNGLQAEVGRLRQLIEGSQAAVTEKIDRQTASMNLVVQEAKGQFAQTKAEQQQVVIDAQATFQETSAAVETIWKGCEILGKEIR